MIHTRRAENPDMTGGETFAVRETVPKCRQENQIPCRRPYQRENAVEDLLDHQKKRVE